MKHYITNVFRNNNDYIENVFFRNTTIEHSITQITYVSILITIVMM